MIVDERRLDVIRVVLVLLYNGFEDVVGFVEVFGEVLRVVRRERDVF